MSAVTRALVAAGMLGVMVSLGAPAFAQPAQPPASQLTPLKLMFHFIPTGSFVNFVVSQDHGFFREEGLDVSFIIPGSPADAIKLVATGDAHIGLGHSTDVILARSRGVPVVSLGATHQFGTAGVMAPVEKNIRTPKDLEGKTVGITGIPANRVMLEQMLRMNGVDATKVRIIVIGFGAIPALLEGRIDAEGDAITFSEPISYNLAKGKDPNDRSTHTYMAFYKYGVPRYYTFGVITSESFLAKNPDLIRRAVRGWKKGLEWSIANPEAAVDIFLKRYPNNERQRTLGMWRAVTEIAVSDETRTHGLGWQDAKAWEKQAQFMFENRLIGEPVDVRKAFTNDFLSGK